MLRRQLFHFCIAGTLGFLVDAGVVQFLVRAWEWNPYGARVLSFLLAVTTTWRYNRSVTFVDRKGSHRGREWARYLFAQCFGFAVNYGAYALTLMLWPLTLEWPAIAVAVGSIAGLGVNFASARHWVFRAPPP